MQTGRLILVGAGPGDPELISLKGLKVLQSADVILYDALIHQDLLKHSPENCQKIYVGKRANNHRYSQNEINELIVHYALQDLTVIRLKGGDPFVFGRGHEELKFAENFDIPTTVIPGISSAVAVPELQNIPLTKRGISESFWVVTATSSHGRLSKDIALVAQSSATAVILMGRRKLKEIILLFSGHRPIETPVALIQKGSLPDEKIVIGNLEDISNKAETENIGTPCIIVIGEVVALHDNANFSLVNVLKNNNEQHIF